MSWDIATLILLGILLGLLLATWWELRACHKVADESRYEASRACRQLNELIGRLTTEAMQERIDQTEALRRQAIEAEAEEPDLRFNVGTEPWTEPGA